MYVARRGGRRTASSRDHGDEAHPSPCRDDGAGKDAVCVRVEPSTAEVTESAAMNAEPGLCAHQRRLSRPEGSAWLDAICRSSQASMTESFDGVGVPIPQISNAKGFRPVHGAERAAAIGRPIPERLVSEGAPVPRRTRDRARTRARLPAPRGAPNAPGIVSEGRGRGPSVSYDGRRCSLGGGGERRIPFAHRAGMAES
jgi:hypothetical protein